ncbi:caspase-1-like [Nycticebus coucang]|uniref:caspase-1-like n=1 Tax=Nycticebus coucang TaxID=9470 RepID=UPI00234CBD74|nr:caspase-1-like [Nycticebus coucang]XP_053451475.1 caspase-1-like [Nycticebus coucang]
MADKVLKEKRRLFIQSVGTGTINGLLDELLEKRVLNQEEMEKVRDENATVMDKARALIDGVIRKGPLASQVFIRNILHNDCHLAQTLQLSGPQSVSDLWSKQDSQAVFSSFPAPLTVQDNPAVLPSSGPGGSLKLCSLKFVQDIKRGKSTEIYPIMEKSNRTRLALIICNTEFDNLHQRAGADVDIRDMEKLLVDLGYSVHVRQDLTAADMITEVKAFAARPEHRTSDSTFLVFMSHGIREGICGKKYSEQVPDILGVNKIFQMLNSQNCPNLVNKPKVIIIQACRGENPGLVWVKDSVGGACGNVSRPNPEDYEDDAVRKAHVEKDFITFCSSTPDNVSWRHPTRGSLFIMRLISSIQEYACSCDLQEIFRKVQRSFEDPDGKAQMPTTDRVTLTRHFYLFPGY